MWRPFQRQDVVDADCHSADGYNGRQGIEGSSFRQLLVWIHASAFSEAYDALKLASQKQVYQTTSFLFIFYFYNLSFELWMLLYRQDS